MLDFLKIIDGFARPADDLRVKTISGAIGMFPLFDEALGTPYFDFFSCSFFDRDFPDGSSLLLGAFLIFDYGEIFINLINYSAYRS